MLKVTISQPELARIAQTAAAAVAPRSTVPVLFHLLLQVKDTRVSLIGTDLQVWSEATAPAESAAGEAHVTLPAARFAALAAALPATATVTLTQEDGDCKTLLKAGTVEAALPGFPAEEFPLPPDPDAGASFSAPGKTLVRLLRFALIAVAKDESRPILTCVRLQIPEASALVVASTDTHRLTRRRLTLSEFATGTGEANLPQRAARLALALAEKAGTGPVRVTMGASLVGFAAEGEGGRSTRLLARAMEGAFPNYERVIPAACESAWIVEKAALTDALRRVMLARGAGRVVFRHETGSVFGPALRLVCDGPEGRGEECVELGLDLPAGSEPLEAIAMNGGYLQQALSVLEGDGVRIHLQESGIRPAVLVPSGYDPGEDGLDEGLIVVMPMQVI